MIDEKILEQIDKNLDKLGISGKDKKEFIEDLKKENEDEVKEEQPTENEEVREETQVEEKVEESADENKEETPADEEKVETPAEESKEEETVTEEEVTKEGEEVSTEETKEEKVEEKVEEKTEETNFDAKAEIEELKKANEGYAARLGKLENLIAKLGIEVPEDATIGASPMGNPIDETPNDDFAEIMRKRIG